MRFLSLLPLALSAHSLLVPPQPGDDYLEVKSLPALTSGGRVSLSCDGGCPFYQDTEVEFGVVRAWTQTPDNKFVVDVAAVGEKVLFNGQQIWPQIPLPNGLKAIRTSEGKSVHKTRQDYIPISTAIEWKSGIFQTDGHDFVKTNPILIEVLAVIDRVVHAERLEIVVGTTADEVGIHSLTVLPYKASPLIDSCTNILCRIRGTIALKYNQWRKAAANKFKGLRGCGRKGGHKVGGVRLKGGPNKFGPGATLHPQGHHGHGYSKARFLNSLMWAAQTFVFPVAMAIYALLIVCSIIKIAIPHIRRARATRRGEYVEVKQSEAEEGRASIDGLPKYEDVIGEAQVEKEDEKK